MSKPKPEEVPYRVLTKKEKDEIEYANFSTIPYSSTYDDIIGYEEVVISSLKYKGTEYKAYDYTNAQGDSVGIRLIKGPKVIVTTQNKIDRLNKLYEADLAETKLMRETLKFDKQIPF